LLSPSDPAFAPGGARRSVGLAANLTLRNFAVVLGLRLRATALLRSADLAIGLTLPRLYANAYAGEAGRS